MFFTEQERQIFAYDNGAGQVWGDPLEIDRELRHHLDGDPNRVLQETRSKVEAEQYAAWKKLIAAVRVAFGMVPYDKATGKGATERHCRNALNAFVEFMGVKKNSDEAPPPSPPSSDSGDSASPSTILPSSPSP